MKKYRRRQKEDIVEAVLFSDPEKPPAGCEPHPRRSWCWLFKSQGVEGNDCEITLGQYLIVTAEGSRSAWPRKEFERHYEEVDSGGKPKKAPKPKPEPKPKPIPMSRPGGSDEL